MKNLKIFFNDIFLENNAFTLRPISTFCKNSYQSYLSINNFNRLFLNTMLLWLIGLIFTHGYQKVEQFTSVIELILYSSILYITWKLYKELLSKNKTYFLLSFLLIFWLLFAKLSYMTIFTILNIKIASTIENTLYLIPYFFYLVTQGIFWQKIIFRHILAFEFKLITLIPFLLFHCIIFIVFILASIWNTTHLSLTILLEAINGGTELIIFDLILLALICCKDKGIYLVALASTMLMMTNFWWMYLYHNETLGVADYSASSWFLSLIIMSFGWWHIYRTKSIDVSLWFNSLKAIKSQVTLWAFSLAMFCVLFLYFLGFCFNLLGMKSVVSMPFLIMIYSVIIIMITHYIGSHFEKPFKIIQKNIENIMEKPIEKSSIDYDFYIEEFTFLQNFITNTFNVFEDRNKNKKALAELALQVAHDIRSPVAAILILSQECKQLPENQRLIMRDAANRIQDIANYMLKNYTNKSEPKLPQNLLISTAILSVISEKRVQFKDRPIKFICEIDNDAAFAFIKINPTEFKRMLSNLINNSVEAISQNGRITVKLFLNNNNLIISITDNGKGMPQDIITKVIKGEKIISSKNTDNNFGFGLGLSHANSVIKNYEGKIAITAKQNQGTTIQTTFKATKTPLWLADKIAFDKNDIIVILDDDNSIHGAWKEILQKYINKYKNIQLLHFTQATHCIEYINNFTDKNNILLLSDFELINQSLNGLDVIEICGLKRSILVTSHYENNDIIKRSILLQTKILPKLLVAHINVTVSNDNFLLAASTPPTECDLIILDDQKELGEIMAYICETKNKKVLLYRTPYELLSHLNQLSKDVKIFIDYDLNCEVNGIELAQFLYKKNFKNLYLATGHKKLEQEIPAFLGVLKEKMDLLKF